MLYKYCFSRNGIVASAKPSVYTNDVGLLRGFAIFDFLRTYNGRPFLVERYLDRFFLSADKLGLEIPYTRLKIKKLITQLLVKNKVKEAGIRLVLTGGRSVDSFIPGKPELFILIEHLNATPEAHYRKGIKLITTDHLRQYPEIKTTNYITALFLQGEKRKRKADDILYVHDNKVLECTRMNFFLVKDGVLITPENNILKGVTRNFILDLAKKDYKIEIRDVHCYELGKADEAFICGTSKMLVPVVKIDDIIIGKGKPGRITLRLLEKFQDAADEN